MSDTHILLDTDAFSFVFDRKPQAAEYGSVLANKIPALTFVSVAELLYGAHKRGWQTRRLTELETKMRQCVILPFHQDLPRLWASIRLDAHRSGSALAHAGHANDLWISACALYWEVPLLTGNIRHFKDVRSLVLIDGSGGGQ